jgi:hypothetical protein
VNNLATCGSICAETDPPQETIYFLLAGGLVKIGYTENFPKRWREIEGSNAAPTLLLFMLNGGRDMEGMIHDAFAADRDHGEWFRPSATLRDFFAKMDEFRKPGSVRAVDLLDMNLTPRPYLSAPRSQEGVR